MATNIFSISPYFSFRWVDNDISVPYNTLPLESMVDDLSYAQQIQCGGGGYQSDKGQIQLISDFVPTARLYTCDNVFVKAITLTAIDPPILGVSFICYNGEIDFSDVDPGIYYAKITYTDENETDRDWRTSPLDVQIFHDGTQLFEATNTKNDKGVVFVNSDGSLLTISFRVASLLRSPVPKTDAEDYEDQYNTLTQKNSIPFMTLEQCIGGPLLLPFWVIEKINLLYSLNKVRIDGQYFAKLAGAEFKPTRGETEPQGAWWQVDIQPNEAYPSDQFITGTPPEGDYIVIKQCRNFDNISDNFGLAGVFNVRKNLIRLGIINTGLDAFTLKVGTSDGGSEIGEFDVPAEITHSLDIGKLFNGPTTVWLSGITGTNLNITFDWNDYLAKNVIPDTSGAKWQKNTVYYFQEIEAGSFATEFDVATGLGNVGTDHEGCVLAGTSGTPNITGLLVTAWDRTLPLTRGTTIGDNSRVIARSNLPAVGLNVFNTDSQNTGGNDLAPGNGYARHQRNAGINRDYNIAASATVPTMGPTENMGTGDPMDVTNEAVILPAFYYVGI